MTIRLHTPLPPHFSDIAEVVHIFHPTAAVTPAAVDACDLLHCHEEEDGWARDVFSWGNSRFAWSAPISGDAWEQKRRRKRALKQACYLLLRGRTGVHPPWGSLTGIRPTRLLYERLARGDSLAQAQRALVRVFDLREDKAQLLGDTVAAQRGLIGTPPQAVDLYVAIPFCTTRCAYCSFFAEAVGKGRKVPAYLDALEREINAAAVVVEAAGLMPRAVYVGGGTPTALTPTQLDRVLQSLRTHFPDAREWTVEAGRPDTITPEILRVIRDAGVTRISINPQTMSDQTLAAIGRAHTALDTQTAFALARAAGFDNINMDVIAALPGEDTDDFCRTLNAVAGLLPESLTIHTLARKHGSRLNELGFEAADSAAAEAMVSMGQAGARAMGMRPYYLYRQKYVSGNLENVGFALPGRESLYNIDIMEETTSILAVGAGAISKRVFEGGARIERAPNVGDVGHYISRVEEMIGRKHRLWGLDAAGHAAK